MLGLGKSPVVLDFQGSTVKDITEKDLKSLSDGYGKLHGLGTNLSGKVGGLAADLATSLVEFHGAGFEFGDADTVRDVVGNLKMLSQVIQSDGSTESAHKGVLQDALEQSISELTKLAVELSQQKPREQPVQIPVLQGLQSRLQAIAIQQPDPLLSKEDGDQDSKPDGPDSKKTVTLKLTQDESSPSFREALVEECKRLGVPDTTVRAFLQSN